MNNSGVWALIWFAAAAGFGVGEMLAAGTFFLLPFAIGALAASLLTFISGSVVFGWVVFLAISLVSFLALKPLARRLDSTLPNPTGIGANRLVGVQGVVIEPIAAGTAGSGLVKVGGESWRAEGRDGMELPEGSNIRVVEVTGTRLVVEPDPYDDLGSL